MDYRCRICEVNKDPQRLRIAKMIRERKPKEEIIDILGLQEYQYRGFLAAYTRVAYNQLLED